MDFAEFKKLIESGVREITLDSDVIINQGADYNQKMIEISADDLTIEGNNRTISGNNRYGIFKILGNNITLRNIVFHNAQGGAIENCNGALNIENCIFTNNKSDSFVYEGRTHAICIINHELSKGGAVYNDGGEIRIEDCIFERNVADYGGAIYNKDGKIVCTGSAFKDNSAQHDGNSIYNSDGEFIIDGCDFEDSEIEIIFNDHEMRIDNSHFESHHRIINRSELISPYEDLIVNQKKANYLISLIYSNNNEIVLNEDIIMYYDWIDVDVDDLCVDGAGHKIQGKSNRRCLNISGKNITFRNIIFEEGFFEISGDSNVSIENCVFKSCDETVIINKSDLALRDCTFEKHNVIRNEGAIQTYGNVSVDIFEIKPFDANDLTDGEFNLDSNILISGMDDGDVELDELTVDGNGHVIENDCLKLLKINRLTLKNVNFENKINGLSSIHVGESLEIINCRIDGLRIKNFAGRVIIENSIFDGNFEGSRYRNEDVLIKNDEGVVDIRNTLFSNLKPIWLIENNMGKAKIEKSNFVKISPSSHNLLRNHGELYLKECSFDDNRAKSHGGVIYNGEDGKTVLEDCSFKKTTTDFQNYGGAIYNEGFLTSVNCRFLENHCQRYGGAISNNGELHLKDCEFTDNATDLEASAIHNSGTLGVDGCQFKGKQEHVIVNNGEITLKNLEIEKHHKILTSHNIHISEDDKNLLKDQILIVGHAKDLIDLIHSGKKEIRLNTYFYASHVDIDVDDLIIDGNGNTINGELSSIIFKIKADNVVLKNIIFKNVEWFKGDGSAIVNYDNTLKIENCTFEKNIGENGAAIYNETGQITIIDSIFKKNVADYDADGGSIFNLDGNIYLDNCKFAGNEAGYCGGAIYNKNGFIDVYNCDFTDNCCRYLGETLMIWYGGAIYNKNGEINVDECNFTGNSASGPGDAIFNLSRICVKNSIFKGDGADDIANYYFASIESCQFKNSLITNFGLIVCRNEADELSGFIENNGGNVLTRSHLASTENGFKYLDNLINGGSDEIVIEDNVCIHDDEITSYGNGIEIERDNLVIDAKGNYIDCNFNASVFRVNAKNIVFKNIVFKNAGTLNCGAIKSTDSTVTFEDCHFYNNISNCGASIQNDSSSLKLKNCIFENNHAFKGSSISSVNSDLDLENCEFKGDSSSDSDNGSVIFAKESNLNLTGCEFRDILLGNSVIFAEKSHLNMQNCEFEDNSSLCMRLKYNSVELNDCKFINNHDLIKGNHINASVQDCLFNNSDGSGKWSSGIRLDISDAIFKNSLFDNNKHHILFIHCLKTKLVLLDCDFEDNAADNFLISCGESSDLILKHCNFKGDFKEIIHSSDAISVFECNFEKNHIIESKVNLVDMEITEMSFISLIHSGKNSVSLEHSYLFFEDVKLDVDGICIDGNMHKIVGNLVIEGKNVHLKNIIFKNPIQIENDGPVTFKNCRFESGKHEVITSSADLTLVDCDFSKGHKILNSGEVTLMSDGEKEVFMDDVVRIKSHNGEDDEKEDLSTLGALFN